jgi:elongation factor Ts
MAITAKEIQRLREVAGVGMMDAKKALEKCEGDFEAAMKHLRESGLAKMAERTDRENAQGAVAIGHAGNAYAIAQVKCETDFVAKSADFKALVQGLADTVAAEGEGAAAKHKEQLEALIVSLKENIEIGDIVRFETSGDSVIDTYLHVQSDRGVNATMVEISGSTQEVAHDIALHIAFARPQYLTRDEVPAALVDEERATLETLSRNEGKPEAALPKIVEGRLNGYFKERCLVEQEFAKDNKLTVAGIVGSGKIVRFAQVVIG